MLGDLFRERIVCDSRPIGCCNELVFDGGLPFWIAYWQGMSHRVLYLVVRL